MAHQSDFTAARMDRVVRVFVSSTFRDMQEERDYLVKHVFPELRKRSRERKVEFMEVDLRWGVTEEQANRGEALPICLGEIERCHYFIGLIGERYGRAPDTIPPEMTAAYPWLQEDLGRSFTELEIRHGALGDPEWAKRAFFYFRDPAYIEHLSPERRADYYSEDAAARSRLADLKASIRNSGLPLSEDYPHPQTLGELILEDLWSSISQEYPAGREIDPLDREAQEHEAFALSRVQVYVGRQDYYDRLDSLVASDDLPLVLLGESGAGKSALLANWVGRYRRQNPEDFVFLHFIGSTPRSTDYVAILHRLLSELKRRYPTQLSEEVPSQPEKLRESLPLWLAGAASAVEKEGRRIILILDALNQLEDRDNAPDLGWLPEYFPQNVRVLLSTTSERPSNDLRQRPLKGLEKRNWPMLTITGLTPAEIRQVIPAHLAVYRKTLDSLYSERLAASPQCTNPLFLKALLDELRVFGVYEELGRRLDYCLAASDPPALFDRILARLELDYERPRAGLVREALSLLWAARRGLTEGELLELLKTNGQPLPRASWSPLFLALEDSLVSRSGFLGFFHDYLRQAVKKRYLLTGDTEQGLHLRLADYFAKRDLDDRQADELPWQLEKGQSWERLKDCLTNLDIFEKLFLREERRHELLAYWRALKGLFDPASCYQQAMAERKRTAGTTESFSLLLNYVGWLLYDLDQHSQALPFLERGLAQAEQDLGEEHFTVALSLNNLAAIYWKNHQLPEAEKYLRQALSLREKTLGAQHPHVAITINNLGIIAKEQGNFAEAERLYQRSLAIRENALGPGHPQVATPLINLAELYQEQGRYPEAEPLYRRALSIEEKVFGLDNLSVGYSLMGLAVLYQAMGKVGEAEPLFKRTLEIQEKVLGPENLQVAIGLNNLAELYHSQGRSDEAEPLYQRALGILTPQGDSVEAAAVMYNLAGLYRAQENYRAGEPLYRQALAIQEKLLGPEHPRVAATLNNLALLYHQQGDLPQAEPRYLQALAIMDRVPDAELPEKATTLENLAAIYQDRSQWHEAEGSLRRALDIRRHDLPIKVETAATCCRLAQVLVDKKDSGKDDYHRAENLYKAASALFSKFLGPEHPLALKAKLGLEIVSSHLAKLEVEANRGRKNE